MQENTALTELKLAFSIPEAARISGISRSTLYLEIAAGRLISRKLRGRTVILREDLQAYLAALPRAPCAEGEAVA